MYIHIGGEVIIRSSELIAIFDLSIEQSSKVSKQFIHNASDQTNVEVVTEEESKSLVITPNKIFYSPISAATLKKRANTVNM